MTLLVDSGPLVTQADRRAPEHASVKRILESERGELVVSAFVAAEADFLIESRFGTDVELDFLGDLAEGNYRVECLTAADLAVARDVARRYADLKLGLADASIVALAARLETTRVLTDDERDFRAVTPLQGGHFTILPADA